MSDIQTDFRPEPGPSPAEATMLRNSLGRDGLSLIASTIHGAVLPRLQSPRALQPADPTGPVEFAETRLFRMLLSETQSRLADDCMRVLASAPLGHQGRIQLLERLARRFGAAWLDDSCSFLQTTIALSRLQGMFRRETQRHRSPPVAGVSGQVALALPPGEKHSFALAIIEHSLLAAGWEVDVLAPGSARAFRAVLAAQHYDLMCVSWSTGQLAETVLGGLRDARKGPHPDGPLLVAGGCAAELHGPAMLGLGVDYICNDIYSILYLARWKKSCLQREKTAAAPTGAGMLAMA